jgi:hypothetical protein
MRNVRNVCMYVRTGGTDSLDILPFLIGYRKKQNTQQITNLYRGRLQLMQLGISRLHELLNTRVC